jgi:hypothetical protein
VADVCPMAGVVGGGGVVLVEEMPPRKGRLERVRGGRWGEGWGLLLLLGSGLGGCAGWMREGRHHLGIISSGSPCTAHLTYIHTYIHTYILTY